MKNQTNYRLFKTLLSPRHIFCLTLTLAFLNFIDVGALKAAQSVKSPDGNVIIKFDIKDIGGQKGCPVYGVTYKNHSIVVNSRLGFAIKDAPDLQTGFNIISFKT